MTSFYEVKWNITDEVTDSVSVDLEIDNVVIVSNISVGIGSSIFEINIGINPILGNVVDVICIMSNGDRVIISKVVYRELRNLIPQLIGDQISVTQGKLTVSSSPNSLGKYANNININKIAENNGYTGDLFVSSTNGGIDVMQFSYYFGFSTKVYGIGISSDYVATGHVRYSVLNNGVEVYSNEGGVSGRLVNILNTPVIGDTAIIRFEKLSGSESFDSKLKPFSRFRVLGVEI